MTMTPRLKSKIMKDTRQEFDRYLESWREGRTCQHGTTARSLHDDYVCIFCDLNMTNREAMYASAKDTIDRFGVTFGQLTEVIHNLNFVLHNTNQTGIYLTNSEQQMVNSILNSVYELKDELRN